MRQATSHVENWLFLGCGVYYPVAMESALKMKEVAYVHAEGMPAHFVTGSKMKPREFLYAFNSNLPLDITVKEVKRVPMSFNARGSAKRKLYRYSVLNRDHPSALNYRRSWFIPHTLDIAAMRRATKYFVGKHDFTSFRAGNCNAKTPIRILNRVEIFKQGSFLQFEFEGKGFLKHMAVSYTHLTLPTNREV